MGCTTGIEHAQWTVFHGTVFAISCSAAAPIMRLSIYFATKHQAFSAPRQQHNNDQHMECLQYGDQDQAKDSNCQTTGRLSTMTIPIGEPQKNRIYPITDKSPRASQRTPKVSGRCQLLQHYTVDSAANSEVGRHQKNCQWPTHSCPNDCPIDVLQQSSGAPI